MSLLELPCYVTKNVRDSRSPLEVVLSENCLHSLPRSCLDTIQYWPEAGDPQGTQVILQVSVSVKDTDLPNMCVIEEHKENGSTTVQTPNIVTADSENLVVIKYDETEDEEAVTMGTGVHVDGRDSQGNEISVTSPSSDEGESIISTEICPRGDGIELVEECKVGQVPGKGRVENVGASTVHVEAMLVSSIGNERISARESAPLSIDCDTDGHSKAPSVSTGETPLTAGTEAIQTGLDLEYDYDDDDADQTVEFPCYRYIMKSQSPAPNDNAPKIKSDPCKPYKSLLKRPSSVRKGHRVVFNESLNTFVESDYVIYIEEEPPPQLVNIPHLYQFDHAITFMDSVTLSPPEGYKDIVNSALIRESLVDEDVYELYDLPEGGPDVLVTESDIFKIPEGMVSPQESDKSSGIEDIPQSTDMARDYQTVPGIKKDTVNPQVNENPGDEPPKLKGILKGGRLWKKSDPPVSQSEPETIKVTFQDGASHRRSVRFQDGQDLSDAGEIWIPLDKHIHSPDCGIFAKFHDSSIKESVTAFHEEKDSPLSQFKPILSGLTHPGIPVSSTKVLSPSGILKPMREPTPETEDGSLSSLSSDGSLDSRSQNDLTASDVEMRLRRLENSDVAHIAQGIIRSNSQIRRTIERNALRRSLIKCSEVKKKEHSGILSETNASGETKLTTLEDKLKWLTSLDLEEELKSLDGISKLQKTVKEHDEMESSPKVSSEIPSSEPVTVKEEPKTVPVDSNDSQKVMLLRYDDRNSSYKKLNEIFKRSDKGTHEVKLPTDVREWKITKNVLAGKFTGGKDIPLNKAASLNGLCKFDPKHMGKALKDHVNNPPDLLPSTVHIPVKTRERASWSVPNGDLYNIEDINMILREEAKHLKVCPGAGVTSDSGYTSSDTSGTVSSEAGGQSDHANDELLEFVQSDLGRIERLRRRYSLTEEDDDGGFSRRPSVRGIKPKFGSTTEILKQMQSQLQPPLGGRSPQNMTGSHLTWPYKQPPDESRQQVVVTSWRPPMGGPVMLPSVREEHSSPIRNPDQKYASTSDLRKLNIEDSNMEAHHIFGRRTVPPDSYPNGPPDSDSGLLYRPPLTPDSAMYVSVSSQNLMRNHMSRTLPRGAISASQIIPYPGFYVRPRPPYDRPVSQQTTYPMLSSYPIPIVRNKRDASPVKQVPTPIPRATVRLQGQRCASWCHLPSDSVLFPPHPLPRTTRPHVVFPSNYMPQPIVNTDERGVPEGASSSPQNMVDGEHSADVQKSSSDRKQGEGVFYALKI